MWMMDRRTHETDGNGGSLLMRRINVRKHEWATFSLAAKHTSQIKRLSSTAYVVIQSPFTMFRRYL